MASELVDMPSPEPGKVAGIALNFPATDSPSASPPAKIPRRVRQRLSECKPPLSAEEIEAKLRGAGVRRQQYLETLSSKARAKARNSPAPSSRDDRGQRLEEKLRAAGEKRHATRTKRFIILKKARMRLSKLDELRQSAKLSAVMQVSERAEELDMKFRWRMQQAEANRKLLLQANAQRRAAAKKKAAKVILQKMFQENAYRECVRTAILIKRASAERKRLASLEAERARAHAIIVEAHKVAKSVFSQREEEGKMLKNQLDDRLQRAEANRAKYLGLRGSTLTHRCRKWNEMHSKGELLSRKLAWYWRQFAELKKTTFYLAKRYSSLGVNENSVRLMPFEQLAGLIEATVTLQTTKSFLQRLELRLTLSPNSSSGSENIENLLKQLVSPKKRRMNNFEHNKDKHRVPTMQTKKLMRYPTRVLLCAYMIIGHPDAVFSGCGEAEVRLIQLAETLACEFECLVKVILDGSANETRTQHTHLDLISGNTLLDISACSSGRTTFRSQLLAFDSLWCTYLFHFVAWKVKDAKLLEVDMMKVANQLERSVLTTSKLNQTGGAAFLNHNQIPAQFQVPESQGLFDDEMQHISGHAETGQLDITLAGVTSNEIRPAESDKDITDDGSTPVDSVDEIVSSSNKRLIFGNEVIVNEIIHKVQPDSADTFQVVQEEKFEIKDKIKEIMERAFWDGITESLKQDPPDYGQVIRLVEEVRDELCEMAPKSSKEEIFDSIDVDILHQVLESGNPDMTYLGKILGYALAILQKLSAPADEDEIKKRHGRLLNELSEITNSESSTNSLFVIATVKGLRFVLEQIKILKREISKARIKIMEPILKGPSGLEYLQKAFWDKYKDPAGALVSLPLTKKWLQSVKENAKHEWDKHVQGISMLSSTESDQSCLEFPPMALRAGGVIPSTADSSISSLLHLPIASGDLQQTCKGERVDVLLRIGLLKLVIAIAGLTPDCLPETLQLNLSRLRGVQGQLQKIIVLSTSLLIFRQMLIMEYSDTQAAGVDTVADDAMQRLSELLDSNLDVGIPEIVQTIFQTLGGEDERWQARKDLMARMLAKSLKDSDPVFLKVSRAVYQATRAIVFSGARGERLADVELGRVGASMLTKKVAEAAEILIVAANVSYRVHGPWYATLTANM